MKRRAVVDVRGRLIFVSCGWTTANGTGLQGDSIEVADEPVEDQALGVLVRLALANSQTNVAFPNFRNGPTPERLKLLKLAGAKTESQYARGVRKVRVGMDDDASDISMTPYRNGGGRPGFAEILDQVISVPSTTEDGELGAAVRRALAAATDGA
jgi:hypothetical protein